MITTVIALDDITLRTSEPINPSYLLECGLLIQAEIRERRQDIENALVDLMIFGTASYSLSGRGL